MSKLDEELRGYARRWRAGEPSPPGLAAAVARVTAQRTAQPRARAMIASISTVAVVVLAIVALTTVLRDRTDPAGTGRTDAVVTGILRLVGGAPFTKVSRGVAVRGRIYVYSNAAYAGPPLASVRTDLEGRYRLVLLPGTYYLAGRTPKYTVTPTPPHPLCQAGAVKVTRARKLQANVVCNIK